LKIKIPRNMHVEQSSKQSGLRNPAFSKSTLNELRIYNLVFILLFNLIFSWNFFDKQSTKIFFLISIALQFVTTFFFLLYRAACRLLRIRTDVLLNSILLFILFELSIFLLTGDISLFGFYPEHTNDLSSVSDKSIHAFRKWRDLSLSVSGLLSAVVYFFYSNYQRSRE
jgi:hypothetical protein